MLAGAEGPLVVGRERELCDLGGIPQAAVGDEAGRAPLHQPGYQNAAGGGGARVLAAVDHEHGAGRALLDRLALGMLAVLEHAHRAQVLARRDEAQRERLPHHRSGARIEGIHVLHVLVAQPLLVERRAHGCRADGLELVARLGFQIGHGSVQVSCGAPDHRGCRASRVRVCDQTHCIRAELYPGRSDVHRCKLKRHQSMRREHPIAAATLPLQTFRRGAPKKPFTPPPSDPISRDCYFARRLLLVRAAPWSNPTGGGPMRWKGFPLRAL